MASGSGDENHAEEAKAALGVSVLTVASRIFGFVRTLAMTGVLGVTFLGNTYAAANAVPNVIFEIVVGGAIAAGLVPALAPALARGDKQQAATTAAGILNMALLLMTPLVLAGLALRGPLMSILTVSVEDAGIRSAQHEIGSVLLLMFLPQIWLYTLGVVLTAHLHARRRFLAPALAPLLSSATVTAAYLLFAAVEPAESRSLEGVSTQGLLILGLGTTAGVGILSLSLLPAALRTGFSWRPVLAIPPSARSTLKSLAMPAVVSVGAQQLFLAVVIVLANREPGGVVAYQLAFTILLMFWGIFPVPLAITAFPGLISAAGGGDRAEFARRCSRGARSSALVVFGAAAILASSAGPGAAAMLSLGVGGDASSVVTVASTMTALAPGLIGYGLYAFLSRAAFAYQDGASPALAAGAGFGLAIAANVAAALLGPSRWLIPLLGAGFSAGMTAGIWILIVRVRRLAGREALEGFAAAASRALLAAAVAVTAGWAVAGATGSGSGFAGGAVSAGAAATAALVVYGGSLWLTGEPIVRSLRMTGRRPA